MNNDGITDYDVQTSQGRGPCPGHGIGRRMGLAQVAYVQVITYGTNALGDTITAV